jgi:hypothetical protein
MTIFLVVFAAPLKIRRKWSYVRSCRSSSTSVRVRSRLVCCRCLRHLRLRDSSIDPFQSHPLMNTNGVLLRTRRREPIHGPLGQPPRTVSPSQENAKARVPVQLHRGTDLQRLVWPRDHLDDTIQDHLSLEFWCLEKYRCPRGGESLSSRESPSMLHHRPGHE